MLFASRGRKVGPAIFDRRHRRLTQGLVGYWSPVLTGPTGLQILDLSGQNNNITLQSMDAPTDWVLEQNGYAVDFDGSNDIGLLPWVLNLGKVHTFNCWMKTSDTSYILAGHLSTSNWYAFLQDSGLFYYNSGGSFVSVSGTANNNAWRMITVVRIGTSVSFYRDAVQVGTTQTLSANNDLLIEAMAGYNNVSALFAGKIAEQSFHSRPLLQSEILELYRLNPGGLGRPLRSNWSGFASAIAYSMVADSRSYALSGLPIPLLYGRAIPADTASVLLQGQTTQLLVSRLLGADRGNYDVSGLDAGLLLGRLLDAGATAYTVNWTSSGLIATRRISADAVAYLASGQDAAFLRGRVIEAGTGQYILVASPIDIQTGTGGAAPYYYLFLLGGSR